MISPDKLFGPAFPAQPRLAVAINFDGQLDLVLQAILNEEREHRPYA